MNESEIDREKSIIEEETESHPNSAEKSDLFGSFVKSVSEKMSDASHAAANAGNTLAQSTKKVREVIVDAGDTMTQSAIQASQSVSNASDAIARSAARASQTIGSTTMQLPKGLGSAVNLIHQSSALQKLTKNLKV
ncbi:MAG: hypothetical protein SVX43_21610, partial [Cyanobacteriota bacterium]|nr:hypothetical protein [Cyanobacteriota bacterium]